MPSLYTERCTLCSGKGTRWATIDGIRGPYTCKPCGGSGERTFKASPEERARKRELAKACKARKLAEAIESFQLDEARVWAWMDGSGLDFARSLRETLFKYGSLTERQLSAARKFVR